MTRMLYLPDEVTIIQMELEIPPKQLAAAVNAGLRPVQLLCSTTKELMANQIGSTVIVSPRQKRGHPIKTAHGTSLTRRQKQVLELASHGFSNTQISEMMKISRRTVSYHLRGIKNRVKVDELALVTPSQISTDQQNG